VHSGWVTRKEATAGNQVGDVAVNVARYHRKQEDLCCSPNKKTSVALLASGVLTSTYSAPQAGAIVSKQPAAGLG